MPAFDVTTIPTTLDPLKPGGKVAISVTATNQLPRGVTARAQKVVNPATFDPWVKPPPNPQRTFNQKGETQNFPFTVEIPADAKAGSFTVRFDVVDKDQPNDNFGQSSALKVVIEVPKVVTPVAKPKPWKWIAIAVAAVVVVGIVVKIAMGGGHKMPNVVGMSIDQAKGKLGKDSLRIHRRDTLNLDTTSYKGNVVIEQRPPKGTSLKPESLSVQLVVQKPFGVVPQVKNLDGPTAGSRIGAAGFPMGLGSKCQTAASPLNGKVVNVSPDERTLQPLSTPVTITVLSVQPSCFVIHLDSMTIRNVYTRERARVPTLRRNP